MMLPEKNRKTFTESAIAFYDGKEVKIVSAKIEGTVPLEPKGEGGFGWDPVFIPNGSEKTFAEMTMEEKNKISMRKMALEKLRNYLRRKLETI
jgi:XTP/dITP diphosphohydrolase